MAELEVLRRLPRRLRPRSRNSHIELDTVANNGIAERAVTLLRAPRQDAAQGLGTHVQEHGSCHARRSCCVTRENDSPTTTTNNNNTTHPPISFSFANARACLLRRVIATEWQAHSQRTHDLRAITSALPAETHRLACGRTSHRSRAIRRQTRKLH